MSTDDGATTVPERMFTSDDLKVAETTFKTVLDADVHQDNKANRILSAMAFLTAAAAQIFARAYVQPVAGQQVGSISTISILGLTVNVPLAAFAAYILFVLLGVLVYLNALGPPLNISSRLQARGSSPSTNKVSSLLFFDRIGETSANTWQQHWRETETSALCHQMTENYIFESHLIAEKAKTKVTFMSLGSNLFKTAIPFLSPLVMSMFSAEVRWFWFSALLGFTAWSGAFALEAWRPPQRPRRWFRVWAGLAILSLMGIIAFIIAITFNIF